MTRPRADVTDAELAVLKLLWERGPSTIRELTDRIYPAGEAAHHATVQKLLERLEAKSCVARRARGRTNVWRAVAARDDLIGHRLRQTAAKLCDGSLTPLLTHLVRAGELSEADRAALRDLVNRTPRDRAKRES